MKYGKYGALALVGTLLATSVLTSCSKKLPDETYPEIPATYVSEEVQESDIGETEPVELIEETEVSEETEATEATQESTHGPLSTPVVTERIVDLNGQLSVQGTTLVNESGEPIQLRGMSSYGLNAIGKFFNEDIVKTLAEDWGCGVIRLAMYTVASGGGEAYIRNPAEKASYPRDHLLTVQYIS